MWCCSCPSAPPGARDAHPHLFRVGAAIGAGIFLLTGTVVAEHAGPAVVLSVVVASVACALAGLCYAELAAIVPVAASAYTYADATLGELIAWIIGWCFVLEYLFASSLVAVGWAGYADAMAADVDLHHSRRFTQAPPGHNHRGSRLVVVGYAAWAGADFFAMAHDGLLPKAFLRIHPRLRGPHVGTLATGITAAVIAGVLPLRLLRIPAYPWVPLAGSSFALGSWRRCRSIHGYGWQCGWPWGC